MQEKSRKIIGKLTRSAVVIWDYQDAQKIYSLGFFGKPVGLPRVQPNEAFHRPL